MSREGERPGPLGMPHPVNEAAESREALLERGIGAFHALYETSRGATRAQAFAMEYFLRSVRRDAARPLNEVIAILYQKLALPGVSGEFRALVSKTASECAAMFGHAGDRIVLPPVPTELFEDDGDFATVSPEITPPSGVAFITAQQLGKAGDRFSLEPLGKAFGSGEDFGAQEVEAHAERKERARALKRDYFERVFTNARQVAVRFIDRAVPADADAQHLAQRVEDTAHTLSDVEEELYQMYGFSPTCVRSSPTERFFIEYFAAAERAGEDAVAFDQRVSDYIAIRARVGAMLNRETEKMREVPSAERATPEQILGVKDHATQAEIEHAYLLRLQVLNPDVDEDRAPMAMLHAAREHMLRRFADSVPETRKASTQSREAEEGRLMRTLRAPGKVLRALFGMAALGAATGIAVHEFAENDSDEPKIVDVAPEDDKTVDLGGLETPPASIEHTAAPEQTPYAPLSNEVTLERGDSVWKIVIDMLRERGLSTSNAQVQYFTHQALVDNGWTALSALEKKPGEKLDVTNIAHMMDVAAGGGDVAAAMESAPSSVPAPSAHAPSLSGAENIPSIFGYGSGNAQDWQPDLVVSTHRTEAIAAPIAPYSELPNADRAEHVMVKGESVYKLVHQMLRSRGLNWTTERINFLTQLVVDKNVERFREMVADGRMRRMDEVWIPAGATLDFSDAVAVVDDMERAKKAGKKARTVKELAKDRGYKYPIMMKFPKE